jgi:hypothetical protein
LVLALITLWALLPSGLLQVRLVGAGEPVRVRPQTRVDRLLSSPRRVDVGTIGVEGVPVAYGLTILKAAESDLGLPPGAFAVKTAMWAPGRRALP